MLGINHYEPTFYTESEDIIKEIGPRLKELIGKRVLEVWIVWENIANEWFKDCPVILNLDKSSVWLLNGIAFKFDEGYFSIYNGLDTNKISLTSEIGNDDRLISIA